MRATIRFSFALIGIFFAQFAAACDMPSEISVPDGKTATEKRMTDAGQQFHQFMIDIQLYQVCLEEAAGQERLQSNDSGKSGIQARENRLVDLHNAASAAMDKVAESFKKSVADYESRNTGPLK